MAEQMVTLAKKGSLSPFDLQIGTDYAHQRAAVTVKTDLAMERLFDVLAGRYKFVLLAIPLRTEIEMGVIRVL